MPEAKAASSPRPLLASPSTSPAPLAQPGGVSGYHAPGLLQGGCPEAPPARRGGGVPGGHSEDPQFSQRDGRARHEGENEGADPTMVYGVPVSVRSLS